MNYKEFFEQNSGGVIKLTEEIRFSNELMCTAITIEELYQFFKERLVEELKEKDND